MTPDELLQSGDLRGALVAAQDEVKRHPTDTSRRGLLCDLLCVAGELERADKQLETLVQQAPELAVGISMLRHVIRAETARQEFYHDGRPPEFLSDTTEDLKLHLEASIAIREGQSAEAAELLAQAESTRQPLGGEVDGRRFEDFRDLDDLTAPLLEVLTSAGGYGWAALDHVVRIDFQPPQRPRDLIWRRAKLQIRDGLEGDVILPATYIDTSGCDDDQLRLARGTTWLGGDDSPVRGLGQRMFLAGDEDCSMLQLGVVQFDMPSSS